MTPPAATAVPTRPASPERVVAPHLWGLDSAALHDAWWAARGVQVVRRDQPVALQRAAELFLLLEPGELVLFDIAALGSRLAWHDALLTRLRIIDEHPEPYAERVLRDADGSVERIERRYRASQRGTTRVILARREGVARMWSAAANPRDGWRRLRRAVDWSRVDHGRIEGRCFRTADPATGAALIDDLVRRWPQPDQSIDGIEDAGDGVWVPAGAASPEGAIRLGPLWLGRGAAEVGACLVGPDWIADDAHSDDADAAAAPGTGAPIAEVTPPGASAAAGSTVASQWYPAVKRGMDVVVAATMLLAFAPVMACIAVLVLLEDGRPLFFGHRRQGRQGRLFRCWKFRTMIRDAERLARDLSEYNLCDGPQVFIKDDPRVTRIGKLLRSSHLDELPQLWNVLRGQMSLVGPRPSPDDENQFCPAWRDARLSVRPGITGLWQLERRRRPGEDFQEWIRYDLEYVERAGLWLDLRILVGTARMMLLGRDDRANQ